MFPLHVWQLRMRESYKRFVKTWIRFANPWIRFVSFLRCSKDSFRGFVLDTCFQKVRFVDSFCSTVFKGIDLFFRIQQILPKWNKSLLHKGTLKDLWCSKDSFLGFVSSTVFKRFVSWIHFGHLFSNYPFCGFVSGKKKPKSFNSFRFGRIRVQIPHP
jgi:hypothetical protein